MLTQPKAFVVMALSPWYVLTTYKYVKRLKTLILVNGSQPPTAPANIKTIMQSINVRYICTSVFQKPLAVDLVEPQLLNQEQAA